jgi:chemotaxis protein MotB
MARKKKHPEHVNLERYLISYADFITLLFATFVVLYALSQVDVTNLQTLENSMKQAFSAPSVMSGSDGLMSENSDTLFDSSQGEAMIAPLMLEYMSQKYEEQSFSEIEKSVDELSKAGEIEGVETEMTDKGLVIRFSDDFLFKPGSAVLSASAKAELDKVGASIGKKFVLHMMRVEGHTDNQPIVSSIYPSNWELSSARASAIIRYFISRFKFMPSLFTAVGFAETRPMAENNTPKGKSKNRRVEILILKNRFKSQEHPQDEIIKMSKHEQDVLQTNRISTITKIENMSEAAKKLAKENKGAEDNMIMLNQVYEKEVKRLSKEADSRDSFSKSKITGQGSWLKPPAAGTKATNSSKSSGVNIRSQIQREFEGVGR